MRHGTNNAHLTLVIDFIHLLVKFDYGLGNGNSHNAIEAVESHLFRNIVVCFNDLAFMISVVALALMFHLMTHT